MPALRSLAFPICKMEGPHQFYSILGWLNGIVSGKHIAQPYTGQDSIQSHCYCCYALKCIITVREDVNPSLLAYHLQLPEDLVNKAKNTVRYFQLMDILTGALSYISPVLLKKHFRLVSVLCNGKLTDNVCFFLVTLKLPRIISFIHPLSS